MCFLNFNIGNEFTLRANDVQVVNEAVHLQQNWIFVAIPKTGTTSIRKQTIQRGRPLVPNPHLNILQIKDAIKVFFLRENLATNTNYPSNHIKSYSEIQDDALRFFDQSFKFSCVRNPWERAVSLYYRQEGIKVSDSLSFNEFVKNHFYASDTCVHPTLHRNQIDWLCDENGIILMDYIFKLEEFESAIKHIFDCTKGKLNLQFRIENRNDVSQSTDYRSLYNDECRKMIQKRFEKDIDHFKFSF